MIKTICAYCGRTTQEGEPVPYKGREYVSHGICPECEKKEREKMSPETFTAEEIDEALGTTEEDWRRLGEGRYRLTTPSGDEIPIEEVAPGRFAIIKPPERPAPLGR